MRWMMLCLALVAGTAGAEGPWVSRAYPQDAQKWWWDRDWWEDGRLPAHASHPVITRPSAFRNGDTEVPATVYRPRTEGRFPVVVFLHGRRGVDELTRKLPLRIAARGFTVLAPDLFAGRFIDPYPIRHDPVLEADAAAAVDHALSLPEAAGQSKTCLLSHTRGGYYALKAMVTQGRLARSACYAAWYPHWQDPNAPEPMQVYQYAPEIDALNVPVLVFIGEHEQYQRTRPILTGIESLRAKGREARLIVYPGVGRGFDFRPPEVRTFADDLATQDSLRRASDFVQRHLGAAARPPQ
ncbi:MAG TPA: dienelactone hydrolase family protein [Burkholderiales bacterium]